MKRLGSSDSLGALMSICPTTSEEHSPGNNHVYSREFQSMLEGLDEEGCIEEYSHTPEKKRRLSIHQVKALEKNFEVENKLEPERKVKLAQELGLQPRQVAVWFQNRRARWKTKQLERDYGLLKANHDSLKHSFDALQLDNQSLLKEIRELKSKLNEDNTEHDGSVKEELIVSEHDNDKIIKQNTEPPVATTDMNCESFNNSNGVKDGSSDSDSSAILNEDNSPNAAISSSTGASLVHNQQFTVSPSPPSSSSVLKFGCSSTMNCYQFSDSKAILGDTQKANYQAPFVKLEEHNFFNGDDEACNFFSDDQAPTLQWYCSDQWN